MIVGHELRCWFDTFLPWAEFSASMRSVALSVLPSSDWIPRLLEETAVETLLDFWAEVGAFGGRVCFAQDELMPFFCMCADPPRFGTRLGRYPEQLSRLPKCDSLLDLGCGVGLGTLEAARATGARRVRGVTLEPLEAWMAERRELPHDIERSREFEQFGDLAADFVAGNAADYRSPEKSDLIICNGLAGGRFLNSTEKIGGLLDGLECNLAKGGVVALANSFHQGNRSGVEKFVSLAVQRGWRVEGEWRNILMRR